MSVFALFNASGVCVACVQGLCPEDGYEVPPALAGLPPGALRLHDGVVVQAASDLPAGIPADAPADVPAFAMDVLRAGLRQDLRDLDALAIRPLRAMVAGTASQVDRDRLESLEATAQLVRGELAALDAPADPETPGP